VRAFLAGGLLPPIPGRALPAVVAGGGLQEVAEAAGEHPRLRVPAASAEVAISAGGGTTRGYGRIAWLACFSAVLFQGIDRRTRRKQPLWLLPQFAVRRLPKVITWKLTQTASSNSSISSRTSPTRWTGSLWRMLSEELSGPSAPHTELDEVGESGLQS
jgi:hypothetical protein